MGARPGQPEVGKALGHPQLPHASREGMEKMDPGSLCGGRKRDNEHQLKQEAQTGSTENLFHQEDIHSAPKG